MLARGPFGAGKFKQVTAPPSRFRSFPAYLPAGSLDKAFCRGALVVRNAQTVQSHAARWASDHLPLAVDFHTHNIRSNGENS